MTEQTDKAKKARGLWTLPQRAANASTLHKRLVYTFCILAAVPLVVMTVFSALFFHFGIQTWFSQRVQTAVDKSQAVAESYLHEHQQTIKADILAMANDIDYDAPRLVGNTQNFEQALTQQSFIRNLSEAIVVNAEGEVLASSSFTFSLVFEDLPPYAIEKADDGEVALMVGEDSDRVRALVKLNNFVDSYLFVGRMVDPQVLSHVASTREAAEDYAALRDQYSLLQFTVTASLVVVGFVMLIAAVWLGVILARQLVRPINGLISVADRVRGGDLTARVEEKKSIEEFDYLARGFNRMTKQIQEQQNELIQANRQLDQRRHFIETVLTGVTSGVLGLDQSGHINVANNSAAELLGVEPEELKEKLIGDVMPEFVDILKEAHTRPRKITQAEIPVMQDGQTQRTFLVRIAIEIIGEEDKGTIITFDDITELQSAQRKAAWADVARRIAHEIKNPLTPIQLSAERLKRKYMGQIKEDQETFVLCTDTIIKHVGDIGHMVNEFSSFARMPEPKMKEESLDTQIKAVLVLLQQAHQDISFKVSGVSAKAPHKLYCDAGQVRQALTNLIQNAIDSVQERQQTDGKLKGEIRILLTEYEDNVAVVISDNGQGLPGTESNDNLTEPYVTHKEKGTGLGLAIVKKIMEDHNGQVILGTPAWLKETKGWKDIGGANVALILPMNKSASVEQDKKAS